MTSLDPSHFPDITHGHHESRGQAVQHLPHPHLPPIPDLRFEQSYLKSIARYVRVQKVDAPSDTSDREDDDQDMAVVVDWRKIAWITTRDQVISPLVQGAVWGFASQLIIPFFRHTFSSLFRSSKVPLSKPVVRQEGELTKRLREWSRSLTTSGLEANIALRK